MNRVFVDTAAWVALISPKDSLHLAAKQVKTGLRRINADLFTTEFVFLEVADGLCNVSTRSQTLAFLNSLRNLSNLEIVPVNSTLLEQG